MSRENIHGTGLVLDGHGLVLRGPSGSGKSLLALLLLDAWDSRGKPAKLVSDDRVEIAAEADGLTLHAPAAIEGLIELRGRGIVQRPFVRSAPLHLVVDLVEATDRMLEEDALTTELLGLPVARCPVPRAGKIDTLHQLLLVGEALRALPTPRRTRKKTA